MAPAAALLVSLVLAGSGEQPRALEKGDPAPFSGVLITGARAVQIVEEEAELDALRSRLDAQKRITDDVEVFWKQRLAEVTAKKNAQWLDDPDLNRVGGFTVGFLAGVGVLVGGAWVVQTATTPSIAR